LTENWASLLKGDLERISEVFSTTAGTVTEMLLEGERREVAILFLDLHGFTSLSEQIDHETLHKLTSGVMKALSRIVEAHGGYVDKFEGDRIMALFGAKRAHDNDCVRAVHCGLKMLDTIIDVDQVLRSRELGISARAGISFGSATVAPDPSGHLTATGEVVNVASRMESIAELNTLLVTEQVKEECGDLFLWEHFGHTTVRGLSQQLNSYRPTGPGMAQKVRFERASRVAMSPFIGREYEMDILDRAWRETGNRSRNRRGGARHVVVGICGEAGVGKTRLVQEFLHRKRKEGEVFEIVEGHTLSFAQPPMQLLRSLMKHFRASDSDSIEHLQENGTTAFHFDSLPLQEYEELQRSMDLISLALNPHGDQLIGPAAPETPRLAAILVAFRNVIRAAVTLKERLVVVLEDIHWMDSSSKEILEFLLGNCDTDEPLLFLLTYRPDNRGGCLEQLDVNPDFANLQSVTLHLLSEVNCLEISKNLLSGTDDSATELALSKETEQFILARSGGNPFFIEALLLSLLETGLLYPSEHSWLLKEGVSKAKVPSSVSGIIRARIDSLPSDMRRALQRCSVLGPVFMQDEYVSISSRLEEPDAENCLSSLESRGFIHGTGSGDSRLFKFSQIPVQETAYDTILRHNRTILHRFAAEALETRDESERFAGAITHHWELAGYKAKAAEWGAQAVRQYRLSWEHDQGLALADKVLEWLDLLAPDVTRAERILYVLEDSAIMRIFRSDYSEHRRITDRMFSIAEEWNLKRWRGCALRFKGSGMVETGDYKNALEMYEEALQIFQDTGDRQNEANVYASIGSVYYSRGQINEALEYNLKALPIQIETGNRKGEANARNDIGLLKKKQGKFEDFWVYTKQALEINREIGNLRGVAIALSNIGNTLSREEKWDQAVDYMEQSLSIHRDIGNVRSEGIVLGNLAAIEGKTGKPEDALRRAEEALAIHREIGNRRSILFGETVRGEILTQLDRQEEALDSYRTAAGIAGELKHLSQERLALAGMALVLSNMSRTSESLQCFQRAARLRPEGQAEIEITMMFSECRENLVSQGVPESDIPEIDLPPL